MRNRIYSVLEYCIKFFALIPLTLITFWTVRYANRVSLDDYETSIITSNGLKFYMVFVISVIAMFFLYRLLKGIPEKWLFIGFTLCYLIAGIFLLTHIQMIMRADAEICYSSAAAFEVGDYQKLQFGEYFYMCPHQLGLTSYHRFLRLFSRKEEWVYFVNLLWIIVVNLCLWQASVLVYQEKTMVRKLIIFFSFAFLPHFFYFFYSYGQVPGIGCLAVAFYFTVRAFYKNCKISMGISMLFMMFACLIRNNYLIGAIALMIIYILKALKENPAKRLLCVALLLAVVTLPGGILKKYYENAGDTELTKGIPFSMYVAMGIQENPEGWRAPGWFNGFNHETYLALGCDVEASGEAAVQSIQERVDTFMENPGYGVEFFKEKLITTWCEPTFMSIWSGPIISAGCETDMGLLQSLYVGGTAYEWLALGMNVVNAFLFGFSLLFILAMIVKKKEFTILELFGVLFFMGGFLFHLIWETSSQYVYPYVVFLIPVAAGGIHFVYEKIGKGK